MSNIEKIEKIEKIELKIFMLNAWMQSMKVMRDTGDPVKAGDKYREIVNTL